MKSHSINHNIYIILVNSGEAWVEGFIDHAVASSQTEKLTVIADKASRPLWEGNNNGRINIPQNNPQPM